jgi:transposase
MKVQAPEYMELDRAELETIIERSALDDSDKVKLNAAIETLAFLTRELQNKKTSIVRLRKLIFGASTEKLAKLFKSNASTSISAESTDATASTGATDPIDATATATDPIDATATDARSENNSAHASPPDETKKKRKGHGRNAAASYRGAPTVAIAHEALKPSNQCPTCNDGKLYELAVPALVVRIKGQAPLGGIVYRLQRLRCKLCGEVFTARPPSEVVGEHKYDRSAGAMIALLKYGTGLPFNRLGRLQESMGIPLPATTQWDLVSSFSKSAKPAFEELIRQAAQGQLLHNDDTTMRVLALTKNNAAANDAAASPADDDEQKSASERTGVFTTGIISVNGDNRIALFFTGRQHAGENLATVLALRAAELAPPIHMCDGLSRNLPRELKTILSNCMAHARRRYVDVVENFPAECRFVLEMLSSIYENDAIAARQKMSNEDRLAWHQEQSAPIMEELECWLKAQIEEKKVEPNSGLGEAINYMLKRWNKLTQFLHVPGAPLDNNICERALKKAILHRKNALFFKTQNGALVGDMFMSLIYTAELCGADPFDYLVALDKYREQLAQIPADWMPWNYRKACAAADAVHSATG